MLFRSLDISGNYLDIDCCHPFHLLDKVGDLLLGEPERSLVLQLLLDLFHLIKDGVCDLLLGTQFFHFDPECSEPVDLLLNLGIA